MWIGSRSGWLSGWLRWTLTWFSRWTLTRLGVPAPCCRWWSSWWFCWCLGWWYGWPLWTLPLLWPSTEIPIPAAWRSFDWWSSGTCETWFLPPRPAPSRFGSWSRWWFWRSDGVPRTRGIRWSIPLRRWSGIRWLGWLARWWYRARRFPYNS